MKVRIGYGLGAGTTTNDERFGVFVDELERHGFDSLWVSERIGSDAPDPVVAMAFAAGRTTRLKVGMSVMVLPGRNPVLVAKELASLDRMSGGRLLPAFGLGTSDPAELRAFGIAREGRGRRFDEALALIRRFWTEDHVSHEGEFFSVEDVTVRPKPRQEHLDVWLGGLSPVELRRIARVADGWLPSFITPAEAEAGRATVEAESARHERRIDPEHFGVLLFYAVGPIPNALAAALANRRPDLEPADLVASSLGALADQLRRFVDVGFSKFVAVPIGEPPNWSEHLAESAATLLPFSS